MERYFEILTNFKNMAVIQVKNGQSCLFWKDRWLAQTLEDQFPQAMSFAKNKVISVKKASEVDNFVDLFNLPLSQIVFQQTLLIQQILDGFILNINSNDVWAYSGG